MAESTEARVEGVCPRCHQPRNEPGTVYSDDPMEGEGTHYVEACDHPFHEPASPTPTEQGEARVECPSCGSNHPGREKRVQHSPGRPFASKWCDDDFHEPAPEGEGEAS